MPWFRWASGILEWFSDAAFDELTGLVAEPVPPAPRKRIIGKSKRILSMREDILEGLAAYSKYIKRLRKSYPGLFQQYRRIGAYLPTNEIEADRTQLEPEFVKTLPTFGAMAFGGHDIYPDPENPDYRIQVRFVFFEKLEKSSLIEHTNDTMYRAICYWDDDKDKKIREHGGGVCSEVAVAVAADGGVRALRMLQYKQQTIRSRRANTITRATSKHGNTSTRHAGGRPVEQIRMLTWALPELDIKRGGDQADVICEVFRLTVNLARAAALYSMVRITATKDGVVMPFTIDPLVAPAFFKDRDDVIIDGKKKRIFHVVKVHVRKGRNGAKTGVQLGFRGLRNFTWNGYQIDISVPGREHLNHNEMSIGLLEVRDDEPIPEGTADAAEMGDVLADAMARQRVEWATQR